MKSTLRSAIESNQPLILPCAHDAISARIIEEVGFCAYTIGGLALIACRYALPDIGIVSLGEMASGVRDIMAGSNLPVLVDADEGYGDVKNVARTVRIYEQMGVGGISLEDQASPKRCGHMRGKRVVPLELARAKLAAAVAARQNPDFLIQARVDSRAVLGLDDAIRRAETLIEAGADAVQIEAPESRAEVETIARRLGPLNVPLTINMSTLGVTPYVPPDELAEMGYRIIVCPGAILMGVLSGIRGRAELLKKGKLDEAEAGGSLAGLAELVGIGPWREIDNRFGDTSE